jgi:hypothetical protein
LCGELCFAGAAISVDNFLLQTHTLPHTLQCRAVTYTETKLVCIKQAPLFNVLLDYIMDVFFE